jgi:hypothetical protein
MPDHFHALVQGIEPSSDLLHFLKVLKQKTAFQYRHRLVEALWQKKFYDHMVRSQTSLGQVAWYIWMNPVRKGLCERPEDYPFSGSFTLDWHAVARPSNPWQPIWRRSMRPKATPSRAKPACAGDPGKAGATKITGAAAEEAREICTGNPLGFNKAAENAIAPREIAAYSWANRAINWAIRVCVATSEMRLQGLKPLSL